MNKRFIKTELLLSLPPFIVLFSCLFFCFLCVEWYDCWLISIGYQQSTRPQNASLYKSPCFKHPYLAPGTVRSPASIFNQCLDSFLCFRVVVILTPCTIIVSDPFMHMIIDYIDVKYCFLKKKTILFS